ncbi:MAG: hypothetical protein ASUL_09884 [Candidatus Aramenus sulfurataquae]|uniref:Uncharacterized protein n=1 Tax=Candidatus Aramenus sulfurataquae TaxID=1326980 RepID=W7KUU1_9CREN|nr:MAG: hypothetical protein ASUL_09884 [Candidatus Aramenus sulfurataquae]
MDWFTFASLAISFVMMLTSIISVIYTVSRLEKAKKEEREERIRELVMEALNDGTLDHRIERVVEEVISREIMPKIDAIDDKTDKIRLILCTNIAELKNSDLCR